MNSGTVRGRLIAALLFLVMIVAAISSGSELSAFFDANSVVFVGVGGSLLGISAYGVDGLRRTLQTVRLGGDPAQLRCARTVVAGLGARFVRVGWLGSAVGIVQMLLHLGEVQLVAPALAVALLCPLYGHLLAMAVFGPVGDNLDVRAAWAERSRDSDAPSVG